MSTDEKMNSMRDAMAAKVKKFDRPIFGYQPPVIERKEGDEWVDDDGKKWTVKDGLKQSISKLDAFKKPWWCPKCKVAMSHRYDDKFWMLYNMCYDCTIKKHTQMMMDGTWEAFEKKMMRENEKSFLKDHIAECEDYIRTFKVPQIHFENGGWEELASLETFAQRFEEIRADIKFAKARLAVLETETEEELNVNIQDIAG